MFDRVLARAAGQRLNKACQRVGERDVRACVRVAALVYGCLLYTSRIYDVYAVPTTCGTGSEVTNACAVELTSLHTKRGLNNMLMFPAKSVLIPELIAGLRCV